MKIRKATWVRLLVIGGAVGALEAACRGGLIKPFTMIPPSQMVLGLAHIVTDPELLTEDYKRYLEGRIRERNGYYGLPIIIRLRARHRSRRLVK